MRGFVFLLESADDADPSLERHVRLGRVREFIRALSGRRVVLK